MSVQTKKRMNKKLIVSIVVLALVSVASILGIVTVLALTQRNIDSSIFIRFTAIDIDGEVEAAYRVGNADTWTSMSGETPHVFNASDAESNTQMNPGDISLTSTNNFVEFRYTFRNFGDADYTGILTLDEVATENNMEIQYKYNDSAYSTSSYGLVVEGVDTADSSELKTRGEEKYTEMVYYVKVSVKELSKSANYSSDFFWLLERYDGEISGEIIPMSTSEFISNGDGTYSVRYKGANINVANVSTDSSYKIENVWNIPNNFGSAPVTKVIPGDELPANTKVVIGDNVITIEKGTFSTFDADTYEGQGSLGLVEIVLGNGLIEVPEATFVFCTNLTSVTIGNKVTSIGFATFAYCTSLINIEISDSVTNIGDAAFAYCTSLINIEIPDKLTIISYALFHQCSSLIGVKIPNSVTKIEANAFNSCTSLTNIVISDNVTTIGDNAFNTCTGLTSLIIGNNVTNIGGWAFYDCSSLTNLTIPNSVISIDQYAFHGCSGLTSLEIPDSVTSIGFATFASCSGLKSVVVGKNVTIIENSAFHGCKNLTSVVIGERVTSIECAVFNRCTNLTSVEFKNPNGWWYADSVDATSGTSFSVSSTVFGANATLLTTTYVDKYWKRG